MTGLHRLILGLVSGALVTGMLGSAHAPATQAQSTGQRATATNTYTFAGLGLSLRYPSTWAVKANLKTADILAKAATVARFDPTTTVVYASDGVAFIEVETRAGTVSAKQFEQAVLAVFTDGAVIKGTVAYQDGNRRVTINHQAYDRADAILGDSHGSGTIAATMLATHTGKTTVFFIAATNLKKPNTALRMKERDGVFSSLTFA